MITLVELLARLKQVDEVSLLEILDISSEDLVDRFEDLVEIHYDKLSSEFENAEAEESNES